MDRFILRAELLISPQRIVSYGYELTATSVFVVTDWIAPLETRVDVTLSLPRVLAPIELATRVAEHRAPGAPGELGGVRLDFLGPPPPALATLLDTIANLSALTSTYRVLLVEDNSLTRDVFDYSAGRYFGQPGTVEIDHAESAERAWELLATRRYDIVIVDYFLPSADGARLITKLRAETRLGGIPIVAISVGGRTARDATMSAGADLFVDKPLVFKDLFATLQLLAAVAPRDLGAAKPRTILVLDDSALVLAVTRAALEQAGFTVVVAEDLTAFERERDGCDPDLILVDVQMPEMYGDDIAATLLGHGAVDVPVVLFSSLEEPELARRSAAAHASGYIWKGAGLPELVRRCREILETAA